LIWKYLGYQWTFAIGSAAAAASILAAMRIPEKLTPPVHIEPQPANVMTEI